MGERKIFGTDGVRDIANTGNMTPEVAMSLGRAYIRSTKSKRIVIGRDTRKSGRMLEGALISGMSSEGAEVYRAGIIPTPGISYAVKYHKADGGAVISASHNPAEYNGIKFLGSDGCKLPDEAEISIEAEMMRKSRNTFPETGGIQDEPELVREYANHTAGLLAPGAEMDGLVFDCANGASSVSVPIFTERVLKTAEIISAETDGGNINDKCGVMYMPNLTEYVRANGKNMGVSFDGDADRVLMCDKYGRIIDGDIILWVLGRWLKRSGNDKAVVTVMSNMALEAHFSAEGIETIRCPVGDRYVLETMRKTGARLGGEQSGHIIASEYASTGDGLCTAVLFLNALHDLNEEVSTLNDRFGRYPQKLTNLRLTRGREEVDMAAVRCIEGEYSGIVKSARIFIRLSGTEPLLRILVEAPEAGTVESLSEILASRLMEYC